MEQNKYNENTDLHFLALHYFIKAMKADYRFFKRINLPAVHRNICTTEIISNSFNFYIGSIRNII